MHGSYVLEAILPRLSQLEELYLTNNYITGVIMQRLAPSLEKLTCLRKLFLQQNDLGKQGAKALRKSFAHMTTITLLTLDYCVLRAEGLYEIACGLQHLTLLETLRINHNGLGLIKVPEESEFSDQAVCKQLADSLSRMTHLKKVELAQSGFGSEDSMTIALALLKANSVVEVDDKKIKLVLGLLRNEEMLQAEEASKSNTFDDEESQPMRCMLSEVYSHNIVRHQPINKNQCGGCQCPRVSIVANFFKGKHEGVETRRASFIGEKGAYNEHVVMKTVPYVTPSS
jgi:Ran GTPase-activating protein (RanGAP) involved in mRNA processing and transport